MLAFDEALSMLLQHALPVRGVQRVPTDGAGGRILAEAQRAAQAAPPFDNSAVDGYAVAVSDVRSRPTVLRVSQRVAAGQAAACLEPNTAARIFTGAALPTGADAVVMQERCQSIGDGVRIDHLPQSGENIRLAGSDIRAGSEILPSGQRLRPQDLALAAAVGIAELPVCRRLRVAVFFTGDELRMPGESLSPGTIYNANHFLLLPLLDRLGCEVLNLGQVADDLAATRSTLRAAARESDLVLTSGGVSVGDEDHVKAAVAAEGSLALWQVAMKPGKPLAFGRIAGASERKVAFIGLPGNPVSSLITFLLLVRPFVLTMQGARVCTPTAYAMRADFDWLAADARREFLRARPNHAGGLDLFPQQGSAVLTSAVWGEGVVDNPPGEQVRRGQLVRFLPFSELLN